jgi:hypothetical protein
MSRSYRKTPIFGHCHSKYSEKFDKLLYNKKFRRLAKSKLKLKKYNSLPLKIKEICDIWGMRKDGKYYWANATLIDMRK